jgi:hypothetical protein
MQRDGRLDVRRHEAGKGVLAGFERADDAVQAWKSHAEFLLMSVTSDARTFSKNYEHKSNHR